MGQLLTAGGAAEPRPEACLGPGAHGFQSCLWQSMCERREPFCPCCAVFEEPTAETPPPSALWCGLRG